VSHLVQNTEVDDPLHRQMEKIDNLRDPCPTNVKQRRQYCLVGHDVVVEQTFETERPWPSSWPLGANVVAAAAWPCSPTVCDANGNKLLEA